MGIEEAFVTILEADAGVQALVGIGDDARIFHNTIPQRVPMPAIHFSIIDGEEDHAMGSDTGLVNAAYQFSCYAAGDNAMDVAIALTRAVRGALSRFKGTSAGVVIQDVLSEDWPGQDLYDSTLDRDGRSVDYRFWYED